MRARVGVVVAIVVVAAAAMLGVGARPAPAAPRYFSTPRAAAVSVVTRFGPGAVLVSATRRPLLPGDPQHRPRSRWALFMVVIRLPRPAGALPAGVHTRFVYVVHNARGWRVAEVGTGP